MGFLRPSDSSARTPEPALRGRGTCSRETIFHGNKASKKADPVGWLRPLKRGTGVSGAWWGRRRRELLEAVPSGGRGRGEAGLPRLAAPRGHAESTLRYGIKVAELLSSHSTVTLE